MRLGLSNLSLSSMRPPPIRPFDDVLCEAIGKKVCVTATLPDEMDPSTIAPLRVSTDDGKTTVDFFIPGTSVGNRPPGLYNYPVSDLTGVTITGEEFTVHPRLVPRLQVCQGVRCVVETT